MTTLQAYVLSELNQRSIDHPSMPTLGYAGAALRVARELRERGYIYETPAGGRFQIVREGVEALLKRGPQDVGF